MNPPSHSPVAQRVAAFLADHDAMGVRLAVAVSGGLDSMCLVHLLLELGIQPALVHINHGLRGEESEADEAFLRAFAQAHDLFLHTERLEVTAYAAQHQLSTQAAARALRYAVFDRIVADPAAVGYLLTAHHADDQAETVLLGLLRGKGWPILSGIPAQRGRYLRPLLTTHRAELKAYQQAHGIAYREDSSNATDDYLRNELRHHVVPALRAINPNLIEHLAERLQSYQEQLAWLEAHAWPGPAPVQALPGGRWAIAVPDTAPATLQRLSFALVRLLPAPFYQSLVRVRHLLSLWPLGKGARLSFEGYTAWREADHICLVPTAPALADGPVPVALGAHIAFAGGTLRVDTVESTEARSAAAEHLDADRIVPLSPEAPLLLRPWAEGDRYQPLGLAGTQAVSDILTNKKVPSHLRRSFWVLVDAEGIVLLQGHRPAERVRLSPATRRVWAVHWAPGAEVPG